MLLNTPIKKIRGLRLSSSPRSPNEPLAEPLFSEMVNRGFSQKISENVLHELDKRAAAITGIADARKPQRKRYSNNHRLLFHKMESILSHYAASRAEPHSSATKKRRTLNGPEELFGDLDKENESPTRRKEPASREVVTLSKVPNLTPTPSTLERMPLRSPETSPSRFTKISPSKGSMNLNGLLQADPGKDTFKKPEYKPPTGTKPAEFRSFLTPTQASLSKTKPLQKKPSIPTLRRPPSKSTLPKSGSCDVKRHECLTHLGNESLRRLDKSRLEMTLKPDGFEKVRRVTVPQPFSLYNKPTILLSQKSISLCESSRLLNKFGRLKSRFS